MTPTTPANDRRSPWALAGVVPICVAAWIALACACGPARTLRHEPVRPDLRDELPREVPHAAKAEPDVATAVLAAHNAERARRRLAPLSLDGELTAAAQAHADEMARRGWISHRGRDGSLPFDRIERAGYRFQAAAENVASGYDRVDEVMVGWMRSPGHRRNVLGPTAEMGVGRAIAPGGVSYWCVTFGTRRATLSRRPPVGVGYPG